MTRCMVSATPVPAVAMANARNQYGMAEYRREANWRTRATANMETSTTTPSSLLLTNMSEIASPAAVVEILIAQNNAVTSGTLAASGCWLNTRSRERIWR